jgi:hypothetical protein
MSKEIDTVSAALLHNSVPDTVLQQEISAEYLTPSLREIISFNKVSGADLATEEFARLVTLSMGGPPYAFTRSADEWLNEFRFLAQQGVTGVFAYAGEKLIACGLCEVLNDEILKYHRMNVGISGIEAKIGEGHLSFGVVASEYEGGRVLPTSAADGTCFFVPRPLKGWGGVSHEQRPGTSLYIHLINQRIELLNNCNRIWVRLHPNLRGSQKTFQSRLGFKYIDTQEIQAHGSLAERRRFFKDFHIN